MVICMQVGDVDGPQTAENLGSSFRSVETDQLAVGSFSAIQQNETIRTDIKVKLSYITVINEAI